MPYIDTINHEGTAYDLQDSYAARSVEGSTASHVLQANEIYTETTQTQFAEFIYRTSAGDASIQTGLAQLEAVYGATVKDTSVTHVDEVLTASGIFADEETTVTLNKNTWRSKVTESGEYTFSYNGSTWQLDGSNVTISQYGLTVTGTVASGDTINVNYVKLQTGALTTANPTSFVATGFNQYDATAGYAHVVGGNQYRIAGTYTSLTFSTTPTGATSAVTITNNRFIPAEDGYIHVVGGSGDILIALVWSGIMDNEPWSAYETSTIVIPTQDAEGNNLPNASYGMPGIGNIRDSISFTEKLYVQRIGHLPFTYDNLETIQNSGAPYIYDTTHIFYALASPILYTLADTIDDDYTVNDFGTEEFTGTTIPIYAGIRYGNSLVDKLRNLVDIQDVGDDLTMDGSTIKTAYDLKDDVPTNFFSGEATISADGDNIKLENTLTSKFREIEFNGKSFQQSHALGKNLCSYVYTSNSNKNLNFSFVAPSAPNVVLSSTINIALTGNSIYLIVGGVNYGVITTASCSAGGLLTKALIFTDKQFQAMQEAKTMRLYIYRSSGGFTVPTDAMIEVGSTRTEYEPFDYTPSPEHPQDISAVTGAQNVLIYGKNIAHQIIGATAGSSYTHIINMDNNVLRALYFGAETTGTRYRAYVLCDATPYIGETLTLRATFDQTDDGGYSFGYCDATGENRVRLSPAASTASGIASTAVVPEEARNKYLYLLLYAKTNTESETESYVDYSNIQLEVNDVATDYEPCQRYEVNLGKNLVDKSAMVWGYIRSTDGAIVGQTANGANRTSDYIPVLENTTYVASMANFKNTTGNKRISFGFYDKDKVFLSIDPQGSGSNIQRATETPQSCAYLRVQFTKTDGLTDADITNAEFQLERGQYYSSYAPYFEPIVLRGIGKYRDALCKFSDGWYICRAIAKTVLDGDNTEWSLTGGILYSSCLSDGSVVDAEAICDYFPFLGLTSNTSNAYTYGNNVMTMNTGGKRIYLRNDSLTTLSSWQTWLNEHNLTVYYSLGNPVCTKITNTALTSVLDKLNNALGCEKNTYLEVSASELPGQLRVTAFQNNFAGINGMLRIK